MDVHSITSCLATVQHRGLVVGPRGTAVHSWDRGWTSDATPWARAPSSGEGPSWVPELDAAADSDRAVMWVADACADHLRWAQYVRAYRMAVPSGSLMQLRTLDAIIGAVRPTREMCVAVLGALVAVSHRAAAGPRRAATVEEAAHVLGWSVEALRAAMRRGDVRSVAVDGKRARGVPAEELERLIGG